MFFGNGYLFPFKTEKPHSCGSKFEILMLKEPFVFKLRLAVLLFLMCSKVTENNPYMLRMELIKYKCFET